MFSLRESRLNSIFEHYYKQNNILLQEIIPPDDIEDYIDVEDLPENERLRVYSVIFNSGQELTDREEKEFLDMIKAKKFQNQELADVEKKFVLSKIDMENMVS